MFNELVIDYQFPIIMGIAGWLIADHLTGQGEILSWWRYYVLDRLPAFPAKPLGLCGKCVAGFWTLVIKGVCIGNFASLFWVIDAAASMALAMGVAIILKKFVSDDF